MFQKISLLTTVLLLSVSAFAVNINDLIVRANQGDVNAQYELGLMYYAGQDVNQDYTKALGWYAKSANQGFASAQSDLCAMFYKGQGVTQDYDKALEWCTKSANQGYAPAQHNLGIMYFNGHGTPPKQRTAKDWYQKACDNGYKPSCGAYSDLEAIDFLLVEE